MTDTIKMTEIITMELTGGGLYSGTPKQCLEFLSKHRDLVKYQYVIDRYFHWSESKSEYVYIPDMHPTYIRNVLLKELSTLEELRGRDFMESILGDSSLAPELVGEMYRIWCELFDVEWTDHRDALLAELESSAIPDEDKDLPDDGIPAHKAYGLPKGAVLL